MTTDRLPIRRIHNAKALLELMEARRKALDLNMEEVGEKAGVCDRYYNKVIMGKETERERLVRMVHRGRVVTSKSSARYPFRMEQTTSWLLEALGYTLVAMPLEDALHLVDEDPATALELAKRKRDKPLLLSGPTDNGVAR